MVIKWKDEYSCFDADIDQQHKKMIDLINQINDIADLDAGFDKYDEILGIFEELRDYTGYHFSREEELFEVNAYDSFNIKIQKLEHSSFIKRINSIDVNELDQDQTNSLRNVLDFLSKWLDHHILVIDKKFGEFLEQKGK